MNPSDHQKPGTERPSERADTTRGTGVTRLAVVTNIPAPYRVPVYNLLAQDDRLSVKVFYGAQREPDREWDLQAITHPHEFLDAKVISRGGRFIHIGSSVRKALEAFNPDVVVTTGYNPLHLISFAYCVMNDKRHVAMTDGTVESESSLSPLHKALRKVVLRQSSAGIAASNGSWRLLHSYGLGEQRIHFSPLCANRDLHWASPSLLDRDIDLLFSGRLVAPKNPGFVLEMGAKLSNHLNKQVSIALLGSGPLEEQVRERARHLSDRIRILIPGHQPQRSLPEWFARSRLFIFPTQGDAWGVVANEACHAGVPTFTTRRAGVANELICDGRTGRVLPLDPEVWAAEAASILLNEQRWQALSDAARSEVAKYSFENAAAGLADAALQATSPGSTTSLKRRSTFTRRPRVVIIQRRLTHYRVPLFQRLRESLDRSGVELVIVHGNPSAQEVTKEDSGTIDWADLRRCHYFLNDRIVVQNPGRTIDGADLVIIPQESRLLYNLWALLANRPSRLAYWGHGRNFKTAPNFGILESVKRTLVTHVDWWFAYTQRTVNYVKDCGFPEARITNLNNSIDTTALREALDGVSDIELARFRAAHDLGKGPIGIFVGSMYSDKRLDFLIESARQIQSRIPSFHLLLAGAGPDSNKAQEASLQTAWIHYLGPLGLAEKALALRASDIFMNPGLVGLGILDSFASGCPIVTTASANHPPEIAYLSDRHNGVLTGNSVAEFTDGCTNLLFNEAVRTKIANNAKRDCSNYSIEGMTENFANGVLGSLLAPPVGR
jgi:glycosyltransferase involved in cell wall biosynthesis